MVAMAVPRGLLIIVVLLCLAEGRRRAEQDGDSRERDASGETKMTASAFHFTQDVYNVTIIENAVRKAYVTPTVKMGIHLDDPTLNIRYKVSDSNRNVFKAEDRTVGDFCFLMLRTRSNLQQAINRESQDVYELIVKGIAKYRNGPRLTAMAKVRVHVLDANDLSPLFYPTSYFVEVREDTPLHQPVTTVSAEDADIGVNGQVYYSFVQWTETFAIHPTSGVVTLTQQLSHIDQNYYELDIVARDRGRKSSFGTRVSKATLRVRVIEVNYNAPSIDHQELPAVIEHGSTGTIYAILYVHDKDYGKNGEIASVEIIEGNENNYFQLEKGSSDMEYTIKVSESLDREMAPDGFNLTISAKDGGTPARETVKVVHVRLADVNDQAPEFAKTGYEARLEECVPIFTPVIFVEARDKDMGRNGDVLYDIAQGNSLDWFGIDRHTGLVYVKNPLDYENLTSVELAIGAQDRANAGSRQATYTKLVITLIDCNDNSPVFNESDISVTVKEGQPKGTEVVRIFAQDSDKGENGFISYSLANTDSVPFTIDHFTGMILTDADLDYESMRRTYHLRVRASDWGSPYRRESETIVEVKLRDENDNKPIFEKVGCSGYLAREAPVGTTVVTISAIDFDAGNIISYQIISGNDDECFSVESQTGIVKLECDITGYYGNLRNLRLTATDGINFAEPIFVNLTLVNSGARNSQLSNGDANVYCRDTDVADQLANLLRLAEENSASEAFENLPENLAYMQNQHRPRFTVETPTQIVVKEDIAIGEPLSKVAAIDDDHGFNGRVTYVIVGGNDGGIFAVDTYSGELRLQRPLDRETNEEYILNVTVQDMGQPPESASTTIRIIVQDVNDNAPVFSKPSYTVSLPESARVNTKVIQVSAEDHDLNENSEITYSIISDTKDFSINPRNGLISVNNSLDREAHASYNLYIQAVDGSITNPLTSQALVVIDLVDVNDNPPVFHPAIYEVRVQEDLPVGTMIMIVTAHDPDIGSGGSIRYRLQDGAGEQFEIDRFTGALRIKSLLDYEKQQFYNITIRARDRGDPALYAHCHVLVEIIDVDENMHTPHFNDFVYSASIRENLPANSTVLRLKASDEDVYNTDASHNDYDVTFSVYNGSGLGIFSIDDEGVIRTRAVLDRESTASYWLMVYARDRAAVPRSAIAQIYIDVEDVNDNLPQPEQPVYYVSVPENSPKETYVVQIRAHDDDDSTINRISYHITSGNPQGFFAIDRDSGVITTTERTLDREHQDEHVLEVTVSDKGDQGLVSPVPNSVKTRVVVTITDVNDESPQFTERIYHVRVPAMPETEEEVELYRVVALDRDIGMNAEIDYSIRSSKTGGRFYINAKTGVFTSKRALEAGQQFDIAVTAVDNGRPQNRGTARVIFDVVEIPTESTNPPVFEEQSLTVQVTEHDPVGHLVGILTATDEDGDKLWYSIISGNDGSVFRIDREDGNLVIAQRLDWETQPEYNLTITATDGHHIAKKWVYVEVLDINEHCPEFDQSVYATSIRENVPVGTDVITLSATDRDRDKRLFYTLHSSADPTSLAKFRINSETGVITVIEELNRERISRHELTVMVHDGGVPSKRTLTRVIINVEDHNDYAPEFISPEFHGRVFETASEGTAVVQVIAVDHDTGINAQIQYSILSGNIGNTFDIDGSLGIISIARTLDRHSQSSYSLIVEATDGGNPALTSTAAVGIEVTVSDNAPPKFSQSEYTTEMRENQPAGTFVAVVTAVSRSSIIYEIIDGNQGGFFSINPNSGVISIPVSIDYEEHSFFNLTVQATNMVAASSTCIILIHIIDENDNNPVFINEKYVGVISEVASPGSVILDETGHPLVVKATDADSNHNALLEYSIVETQAQSVFMIDASTGAVRTRAVLDHETSVSHEFTVQVRDQGTVRKTAEVAALVVIQVTDVNDSPPSFTQDVYTTQLLLPTYTNIEVIKVAATDLDSSANDPLTFEITAGDEEKYFYMDPTTGSIRVKKAVGLSINYNLTVTVFDGLFNNHANVIINVLPAVQSGLRFQKSVYQASVMENDTHVERVIVVQAVGHALNEHLTFRILNPSSLFTIGETSGVIQTTGITVDREVKNNYTLVVEVADQRTPRRIAHALVDINVRDINDNAPMFVNKPYYAIVSVESDKGNVIKQVSAVDVDDGPNGEVEFYLLEGGDGKFRVHQRTGDIFIVEAFTDDDQNKEYMLRVQAQDKGAIPLSSESVVNIRIMNKATPVFEQQVYSVTIRENSPVGSAITTLTATSPTGNKLIYSITEGDVYNEFDVHFSTGAVTLVEELDYELRQTYQLTIRATDILKGTYAEAILQVHLEDVNDHDPSFTSLFYMTTISEAAAIGTSLLSVSASDDDTGDNAAVRYHIEPIDGSVDHGVFHIDAEKGIIFTKQHLDHEVRQKMYINVVATDRGVPARNSSVLVTIIVLDLNDNPPTFDLPSYEVTITDLAKRGQFVSRVTASDADETDASNLAFSIVGGNERQSFMIDEYTGIISLSSLRTPDLASMYSLNVSVTDGVFTNFARVQITVQSSNNFAPVFERALYEVSVLEDALIGTLVARATATDEDPGIFGQLTYELGSEDAQETFTLDPNSGELKTKVRLDREEKAVHHVSVRVMDGGGQTGFTVIRVMVADQPDNQPQFMQAIYRAAVEVDMPQDSQVLQVTAVDPDLAANADLTYALVDSPETELSVADYLLVEAKTGIIRAKESFEGLENHLLQFFVRVADQGAPPQDNAVPVEIYIMSPEDRAPVFAQDLFTYFIEEDSAIGTVIATIPAEGNDTLSYSIVDGNMASTNSPMKFDIDESGKIIVIDDLDREVTETFELTVQAETQTSPSLVAWTRVTVQIMDVNDNQPRFESEQYEVSVAENAEVGSRVAQVSAGDEDKGANAVISYTFAPEHASLANTFAIDSRTGWITTLVPLDREAQEIYQFDVVASDRGALRRLKDQTHVRVTLMDDNDSPPVFTSNMYRGAVNEDALPGTIVLSVQTHDEDLSQNAVVVYYITDGDPMGHFNVRPTGEVYVNRELDREQRAIYVLSIMATDGAFIATATVQITILDANDNSPVCDRPLYEVILAENTPVGSYVVKASATDADEAGTRNARIRYTLEGEGASAFVMHEKSGIISTRESLDRENQGQYHLFVKALDYGDRSCTTEIYITLTDVNDNAPRFAHDEYSATIPENAEVNTLLTRVSAIDYDLGINRKVRYALRDTEGHFLIDPSSGIVSVASALDRESKSNYNLTLYAYDQGTPKLTSTAFLLVRISDINDNPPMFERSVYKVYAREDTPPEQSVATVHATSLDIGQNAVIRYSIVDGNSHQKFRIDPTTGGLYVSSLDFESEKQYMITVMATDGGTPPLSSMAVVHLNVTDANDNDPVFAMPVYIATMEENTAIDEVILQVSASDADEGINAAVQYRLITDSDPAFAINATTGHLRTIAPLDREQRDEYHLKVEAVDLGAPSRTGSATINIHILDVNDNPPMFGQTNYTALVQVDDDGVPAGLRKENMEVGMSLLQLDVTDVDLEFNGPPFLFDIVEGNINLEFRINNQGVLSTTAHFDRQIKDTYDLIVRVLDNGDPPLYSDIPVTVKIVEESVFPPVIVPLQVQVSAFDDEFYGGIIGQVQAEDRDIYDTLSYDIASDNRHLFEIDPLDGTLRATQSLDAGQYIINVSVTDGKFVSYTDVTLRIDGIDDDMAANAVVVRIEDMLPEEFFHAHRDDFIEVVQESLGTEDVMILSIQPAASDGIIERRRRRNLDARMKRAVEGSDLDIVVVAKQRNGEAYMNGKRLRRRLQQIIPDIQSALSIKILDIENDICKRNMCDGNGECVTEIAFLPDDPLLFTSNGKSYVSPKHEMTTRCRCKSGYEGPTCEDLADACNPNPCPTAQICMLQGSLGYRCECPQGKTGALCDHDVELPPECSEPGCMEAQPLSFSGHSYANWRLTDPMERRFRVEFELRTVQSTARLMHAVGRVDYSILELINGMIQYRFDCGSGEGLVRVDSILVNDGVWHLVEVERHGNDGIISIDKKYTARSSAPGTNAVLNLDSNDVFFGAEVHSTELTDVRLGFEGCMRNIKVQSVALPYIGSNSVGTFQSFSNMEFTCKRAYVAGVCSSSPCMNGGTCVPHGPDSYACYCQQRYVGAFCQVDTNPCISNPCLHGGRCTNLRNDYQCRCPPGLEGKNCAVGYYCKRNPCLNRGICIDGDTGPICQCQGFSGLECEHDIDECQARPCKNGGKCVNEPGSYRCECSVGISGSNCENINFSSISSTSLNITLEEIIGIASVVLALLIVVLIFVFVVRWRRRKRREQMEPICSKRGDFIYNCESLKAGKGDQLSNSPATQARFHVGSRSSPRPPPLPARPASYTPSIADSMNTLNNLDSVHNYGSAGDELENVGTLPPFEIPEFLQNVDAEKSPTPVRTHSLPPPYPGLEEDFKQRKPSYDLNRPNMLSPEGEVKRHNKSLGMDRSPPGMEPEEDLPAAGSRNNVPKKGYHWDTSDWAPHPALPNITEVPMREIPDSPGSSLSNDSNLNIYPEDYEYTDYPDEDIGNDSEYVGETENECYSEDDLDERDAEYPDRPNFEQILAMHGDLNLGDPITPNNYRPNFHPDDYLPTYQLDSVPGSMECLDEQGSTDRLNGNADTDQPEVPPRGAVSRFLAGDYGLPRDYTTDAEFSAMSAIDEMSVSMGGYTSTNASVSDISGLCEIEDSCLSDNDSVEDNDLVKVANASGSLPDAAGQADGGGAGSNSANNTGTRGRNKNKNKNKNGSSHTHTQV